MHSRLYRRVLNQYEWVHNCTAFNSLYNHSGLVGVFISTERARSGQAFDIITKELQVRLFQDFAQLCCSREQRMCLKGLFCVAN